MDTVVLKFGGSSLANNERLMMVANKIIEKSDETQSSCCSISTRKNNR